MKNTKYDMILFREVPLFAKLVCLKSLSTFFAKNFFANSEINSKDAFKVWKSFQNQIAFIRILIW